MRTAVQTWRDAQSGDRYVLMSDGAIFLWSELTGVWEEAFPPVPKPPEESWTPTESAHFCNQAGSMGGGCKDSWHVGGNYGSHVCKNPNHHDYK